MYSFNPLYAKRPFMIVTWSLFSLLRRLFWLRGYPNLFNKFLVNFIYHHMFFFKPYKWSCSFCRSGPVQLQVEGAQVTAKFSITGQSVWNSNVTLECERCTGFGSSLIFFILFFFFFCFSFLFCHNSSPNK